MCLTKRTHKTTRSSQRRALRTLTRPDSRPYSSCLFYTGTGTFASPARRGCAPRARRGVLRPHSLRRVAHGHHILLHAPPAPNLARRSDRRGAPRRHHWAKSRKSHLLSGAPLAGLLTVVMPPGTRPLERRCSVSSCFEIHTHTRVRQGRGVCLVARALKRTKRTNGDIHPVTLT